MHTFFINTSNKILSGYDVLFDIHRENKTFVSMNCAMSDWYDNEKGYMSCVKQMSEMIDGYVELNNTYNLIVYVDLPENKVYSSIPRDEFNDDDREECGKAMHILYTHIISNSLVSELSNSGRKPQDVLIMFGQEKYFVKSIRDSVNENMIMQRVLSFIGIPDVETVKEVAIKVDRSDAKDKIVAFKEGIAPFYQEELLPGIRDRYDQQIELWYDSVVNEGDVENANLLLYNGIKGIYTNESDSEGLSAVSCPYDCYACRVNKSILAQSELNIALHILKCVELETVYQKTEQGKRKQVIPFHKYSVEEIAPVLKEKMDTFSQKRMEIKTLSASYESLNLAPILHVFDYEKFGLDQFGTAACEFEIDDVEKEDATENDTDVSSKEEEDSAEDGNTILIEGNDKEIKEVQKKVRSLFTKDEYKPFDYNFTEGRDQMFKKDTTPEQYIARAKKVRKHHLDYLKKLDHHVSDVMSNYAGKSKQNTPALLRMGQYRYAIAGSDGKETRAVETLKNISDTSYTTIMNQYMDFCASRTVAISDIEEQCNWFISRVEQIKESLRKLKQVAIGLLIAILVLYLPFVIIQFESIVANALTLATALGSIAIPVVLLYSVFTALALRQKKRYIQAWKDFEKKSEEALEANKIAVEKYDRLLSTVIPALRFVYEYKLDIDYFAECCDVAEAKLEHHKRILGERIAAIDNILGDLEYKRLEDEMPATASLDLQKAVDYTVSFCSGQKNRTFYSVINRDILMKNS